MADRVPAQQSGDAHEDLLATLAASRELGPEMDAALAERYMQKHGQPAQPRQAQQNQQQDVVGPQGQRMNPGLAAVGPALGIAVYIALLIASGGHLWWMFWVPMALGGWWGGMCGGWWGDGRSYPYNDWRAQRNAQRDAQRDAWRYQRRMSRDQYRAWRRGYGTPPGWYDEPRGQGGYSPYPADPRGPYPPTGDARQQGQPPYGQGPNPLPSTADRDVL
jgi:hypothetical protein